MQLQSMARSRGRAFNRAARAASEYVYHRYYVRTKSADLPSLGFTVVTREPRVPVFERPTRVDDGTRARSIRAVLIPDYWRDSRRTTVGTPRGTSVGHLARGRAARKRALAGQRDTAASCPPEETKVASWPG